MGKRRVIAETGAGQHGVATATACARFGLECVVYMGEEDIRRQRPNVFSMKLLGAEVRPVTQRLAHPARRHQRGHARLDELGRDDALHASARSSGRTRFRGSSAISSRSSAARRIEQCLEQLGRLPDAGRGLRRRRQQRGRHVLSVRRRRRASTLVGVEAGGRSGQAGRPRRHALLRPARRAARQLQLRAAGRRRPDLRRPLDLGRAGLSRRRPGAQLLEGHRPRDVHLRAATTRPWRPSTRWPAPKASCRPWKARTPWPRRWKLAARAKPRRGRSSSASPAAATRTPPRSPGCAARRV